MARELRKYEAVWNRIRDGKKHSCTLADVHPAFLKRVKKAVSKEKDADKGFKLLNDHDHFYLEFDYNRDTQVLIIRLKQSLGLEGVKTA
jgi:hypothetical protein